MRATAPAILLSSLGLVACGAAEAPPPRATAAAATATATLADPLAHTFTPPKGWDDLSDDLPPALEAAQDDTHAVEDYFLRGTVGRRRLPVAVYVVVERVPRLIGVDAAVAVDRRGAEEAFGDDVRLGELRKTRVAGEDARAYEQSVRVGDFPAVQRQVVFKRGDYAVYTITLTAPNRRQLAAAAPGLRTIVGSWRWTG